MRAIGLVTIAMLSTTAFAQATPARPNARGTNPWRHASVKAELQYQRDEQAAGRIASKVVGGRDAYQSRVKIGTKRNAAGGLVAVVGFHGNKNTIDEHDAILNAAEAAGYSVFGFTRPDVGRMKTARRWVMPWKSKKVSDNRLVPDYGSVKFDGGPSQDFAWQNHQVDNVLAELGENASLHVIGVSRSGAPTYELAQTRGEIETVQLISPFFGLGKKGLMNKVGAKLYTWIKGWNPSRNPRQQARHSRLLNRVNFDKLTGAQFRIKMPGQEQMQTFGQRFVLMWNAEQGRNAAATLTTPMQIFSAAGDTISGQAPIAEVFEKSGGTAAGHFWYQYGVSAGKIHSIADPRQSPNTYQEVVANMMQFIGSNGKNGVHNIK